MKSLDGRISQFSDLVGSDIGILVLLTHHLRLHFCTLDDESWSAQREIELRAGEARPSDPISGWAALSSSRSSVQ